MISIKNKYSLLFILSVFVFQAAIILYPGWREDDAAFFLIRLKNNLFGDAIGGFSLDNPSDRFIPFYYFGYQFISFLTFKPFFFFLYNLFLSLSTLFILQAIALKLKLLYWPLFIFILFVPGHTDSFYQIVNPEKELLFFWSFFLFTIITIFENKTNNHRTNILLLASFLLILFSLFLKETTFIILSSLCSSLLVLSSNAFSSNNYYLQISLKIKSILYVGLLLSVSFLLLYFIFSNSEPETGYHYILTPADTIVTRILFSAKSLILFSISDPLIVLLLPILFFYTVYQRIVLHKEIFKGNIKYVPFIDACAITALSLVAAHVVLGFHGFRYLLPAYPFGLIAISAYLQIYIPCIKKYFKNIYLVAPCIFLSILLINSISSAINLAVFYKVSSYNFMQYKDALIQSINHVNLTNNNLFSFYIPGKSRERMLYSVDRHKDLLSFYEVRIDKIKFEFNNANHNWVEQSKESGVKPNLKKGDILLILPNSTISQDEILSNLQGLQLREIIHTESPNYFEIPEIRHFLKYIMLINNPNILGTRMVYREVDYAIFEVL
jgi:hypothetical protein